MAIYKPDAIETTNRSNIDYSDTSRYQLETNSNDNYSVLYRDTDGTSGNAEYEFTPNFKKWHGYYREHADFAAVIDKLASWGVGKGYEASKSTKKKLKRIIGFGKDDFNTLIENLSRTFLLCGDSFAEIIKDKWGRLINLKPLNPGKTKIIVDNKGMIKRYEYHAGKNNITKFKKDEIFHMPWNRIADEVHGLPFAEKVEELLKMKMESMRDLKVVYHRYVQPVQIISADTDDTTEVQRIKTKIDNAYKNTENVIVPSGTIEKIDSVSIPQYSTLDPLPWLKFLSRQFVTGCGVPEVIMGWGEDTTEASSKIIYLAFEQTIRRIQRFIEEQLRLQVGIEINLEFPASLEEQMTADQKKDKTSGVAKKSDLNPAKENK
jgi:hypothetical protein